MPLWPEVRSALRALLRDRVYTTVAILTLAFGIAANTAIFSVVDGVLLRPLRYAEPGRLVVINEVIPELTQYPKLPVSARHYFEWRERVKCLDNLALLEAARSILTGRADAEQVDVARVSASLLPMLGTQPQLGRGFLDSEDQPGGNKVVLISDAMWTRRFNRDPAVLGRSLTLDGTPRTIVGVLPATFRLPDRSPDDLIPLAAKSDIYEPIAIRRDKLDWFGPFNYVVIARLKPGVSERQAAAQIDTVEAAIAAQQPQEKLHLRCVMTALQEKVTGASRKPLLILLGAVAAVLLIVCVNLANLALARSAARSRDLAIRRALGASRRQLLRGVLTENLCIGLAGGVLGVLVAAVGIRLLVSGAPVDLPRLDEISLDARVLAFAFGLSALSGLLFGLVPAWHAAGVDPQRTLRDKAGTATQGRRGRVVRHALVAFESGLSAVLLVVAGLLVGSFFHLLNVDKGFQAEHVVTADLRQPPNVLHTAREQEAFYRAVLDTLRAIPGATAAALVSHLPVDGEEWVDVVQREGEHKPTVELPPTNFRFCSSDYFRAMGIGVVAGRTFTDADRQRRLAVVSESTARVVWPGQDPIGKRFYNNEGSNTKETPFEVAGVVRDVRIALDKKPVLTVYIPYWSDTDHPTMHVVVRSAAGPLAVAGSIRQAVSAVHRDSVVDHVRTMDDVISTSVGSRRFQMLLTAAFAGSALLLACLGIYGVVSWSVVQRRKEIGVRMAIGAPGSGVRRMVVWQGMQPVLAGIAMGLVAALALGRLVASLLFGISARDPLTIVAVACALTTVAAVACYVPAWRATRADPLGALRCE